MDRGLREKVMWLFLWFTHSFIHSLHNVCISFLLVSLLKSFSLRLSSCFLIHSFILYMYFCFILLTSDSSFFLSVFMCLCLVFISSRIVIWLGKGIRSPFKHHQPSSTTTSHYPLSSLQPLYLITHFPLFINYLTFINMRLHTKRKRRKFNIHI